MLFHGTCRSNLDPFDNFTDEELWLALEQAHMKDTIAKLPNQLRFEVAENGGNFSVGERFVWHVDGGCRDGGERV